MNLSKAALVIGATLVGLGIAAYVTSMPDASPTALIPAVIGAILAGCGLVARNDGPARRHAMHAAAAVALLGALGSVGQLIAQPAAGSDNAGTAKVSGIILLVLCSLFVVLAVRSFVAARRERVGRPG